MFTCYCLIRLICHPPQPMQLILSQSYLSCSSNVESEVVFMCNLSLSPTPVAAAGLSKRGANFQPTSYKLSIYLYVNSALCSFSRKCSVTPSYQLAVFSSVMECISSVSSKMLTFVLNVMGKISFHILCL